VHGGNRLGANSLLDTLVFGRRSGEHAAKAVHGMGMPEPSRSSMQDEERGIQDIVNRNGTGRRVSELKAELGATMDKYVAVFRDEDGLGTALEIVRRLKDEAQNVAIDDKGTVFNQDVLGALELQFMLDNAEAIVISAIERKESRGAVPHRLSRAKRRRVAQAHQRLGERRRSGALLFRGDHDPVGASRTDLLRWPISS
jgi:succinate dehydrogenase / fumarate reductase flavoprotein subunit